MSHPDDETFSSGGTILKLSQAGHEVKLINVTLGEKGQLGEPPITTKENLAQIRKNELECAAKVLGIKQIFYLGFHDATLSQIPTNNLFAPIMDIFLKEKPDVVVTFDKRGGSNHPDHIVTSRVATKAYLGYQKKATKHVRLYHTATPRSYVKKFFGTDVEYMAFGCILGVPDRDITTIVDISDVFDKKVEAFQCHATQKKDWQRLLKRGNYVDIKKEFFQLISENNIL